ncbi:MAG: hypothetical protein U1F11_01640 [Steroidobacteraceae bacterium]
MCEQLVEHDAERVDVACDRDRLREDLLGRGVVGRERPARLARERGVRRAVLAQQLRRTEVEQPYLAGGGHEDVGGLEVAVHDEPPVRIGHGARDLQEQAQALPHPERVLVGVAVDGLAIDELHCDPRAAALADAGIVEARDVRVLQGGQAVALLAQPLRDARRPVVQRQLERDLALQRAVGALGEPHRAHAAAPELVHEPVGAERLPGPGRIRVRAERLRQHAGDRAAHEALGGSAAAGEQLAQHRQELLVRGRAAREPGVELRRRLRERLAQQRIDATPACRIGRRARGHAQRPSMPASSSRARSQSRRTVRSLMPRARPISSSVRPAK